MPLNPSGQTPTSSPPQSSRSASALQARVLPALRASSPTTGVPKTRSAPSIRRWRWPGARRARPAPSSPRPSATVPEWLATTSAPPSAGHVLDPAHLDPEPLLEHRPQHRQQRVVGEVGVEAELVDRVVAGDAGGGGRPVRRPGGPPSRSRSLSGRGPRLLRIVAVQRHDPGVRPWSASPRPCHQTGIAPLGGHDQPAIDQRDQPAAADERLERPRGGVRGGSSRSPSRSRAVSTTRPKLQQPRLLGRDVDPAGVPQQPRDTADRRRRDRADRSGRPAGSPGTATARRRRRR